MSILAPSLFARGLYLALPESRLDEALPLLMEVYADEEKGNCMNFFGYTQATAPTSSFIRKHKYTFYPIDRFLKTHAACKRAFALAEVLRDACNAGELSDEVAPVRLCQLSNNVCNELQSYQDQPGITI